MKIQFTGNIFVDAGLAGMCAAAEVKQLEQLDEVAVRRAVRKLVSLMTSDAAFTPRIVKGEKKPKTFAGSDMTVIQTKNGVLSQSSCRKPTKDEIAALRQAQPQLTAKQASDRIVAEIRPQTQKQNYKDRLNRKLDNFLKLGEDVESAQSIRCFVDGGPACAKMGNDEFPMVDSKKKRNFHPGLVGGHSVGAVTSLALEFFPLSVLRTGNNGGWFWFIHTAEENVAVSVAQLTLDFMNDALNKGDFGFFGNWRLNNQGKETAMVGLIRELTCGAQRALTKESIDNLSYPVTAYLFSNDSRNPNIEAYDLPHTLLKFFVQLRGGKSLNRWNHEVLNANKKGWLLSRAMLRGDRIVSMCLFKAKDSETVMLRGGWNAHAHYAQEILQMNPTFIRDIETLSQHLFEDPKAKTWRLDLQKANGIGEVRRVLLRFCREQVLDDEMFARLVPPDTPYYALSTRDYLLAALYDRFYCAEQNTEFELWDAKPSATENTPTPLLQLVESVGDSLLQDHRHKQLSTELGKATRTTDVRQILLRGAKRGLISWAQWTEFFPPEQTSRSLLMRDYLLAYIYTHMDRDEVQTLPEPAPVDAREAQSQNRDEIDHFLSLVS